MAEVKWIKIATDIFDDDKILLIETLPEADSIICLWLKLMLKATNRNEVGYKEYKINNIELTDQILNTIFRYNGLSIGEALKTLCDYGLIKRNENSIVILPFWKDDRDRNDPRYRRWRESVFERDGYKCKICGSNKNIQAHHIIPWSQTRNNKGLRYDIDNGITLCRKCHLKAHGGRWCK